MSTTEKTGVAGGTGGRVLRAAGGDGQAVFVKHFGREGTSLGRRLHVWLSAVLTPGIWSATPLTDARGLMERELRRNAAFRAAGIAVPDLAPAGPEALAASDAGPDAEAVLKRYKREGNAAAHDALLVDLVASLADIHAAGLCHGRPHPRDTSPAGDGTIVWFDFEEEPEAAMPLLDAQARDLWLLFFHVCRRAIDPQTPARALQAYRAAAPAPVCERLGALLTGFAWTLVPARLLLRLHDGGDLRRYVGATSFLTQAFQASAARPVAETTAWGGARGGATP